MSLQEDPHRREEEFRIGEKSPYEEVLIYSCRKIPTEEKRNLESVKSHLMKKYCREERNREEALNALNGCRLPGETNERFAYRMSKLVQLAHAHETEEIQTSIAKYYFKQGSLYTG